MGWKKYKTGWHKYGIFFHIVFFFIKITGWLNTNLHFIENLSNNIRNLLDYRQYGAWYLHPRKWENRFQSLSDPKSIEIVKARRIPRGDKTANKQDVTTKKVQVTKFEKYKTWDPKVQLFFHLSNSWGGWNKCWGGATAVEGESLSNKQGGGPNFCQ